MTSLYVVHGANETTLVVRRYMDQGPFVPNVDEVISHNTVALAKVEAVTELPDCFTITADRRLPYILIGTILGIGRD